jgi:hypothetical protein
MRQVTVDGVLDCQLNLLDYSVQFTVTNFTILQCISLSSLGRVPSRLGPGPPADPTHFAGSSPKTAFLSLNSTVFPNYMEPKGSLPCSQEPATGPYPEQDESSPYHPILFLQNPV